MKYLLLCILITSAGTEFVFGQQASFIARLGPQNSASKLQMAETGYPTYPQHRIATFNSTDTIAGTSNGEVWVADYSGVTRLIGMRDASHTGPSGEHNSTIIQWQESGVVAGKSRSYVTGLDTYWVADRQGNTTVVSTCSQGIGPTGVYAGAKVEGATTPHSTGAAYIGKVGDPSEVRLSWYDSRAYFGPNSGCWIRSSNTTSIGEVFRLNWNQPPVMMGIPGATSMSIHDFTSQSSSVYATGTAFSYSNGGQGTWVWQKAWLAHPDGGCHAVGLFDARHTTGQGAVHSIPLVPPSANGHVAGQARRMSVTSGSPGGSFQGGYTTWVAAYGQQSYPVGPYTPEFDQDVYYSVRQGTFDPQFTTQISNNGWIGGATRTGPASTSGATKRAWIGNSNGYWRLVGTAQGWSKVTRLTDSGWYAGGAWRSDSSSTGDVIWSGNVSGGDHLIGVLDSSVTGPNGCTDFTLGLIDADGYVTGSCFHSVPASYTSGRSAFIADPQGNSVRIGLYDSEHTSAAGVFTNTTLGATQTVWWPLSKCVIGSAVRRAGGTTLWIFDGLLGQTIPVALSRRQSDGLSSSAWTYITANGIVVGKYTKYQGETSLGDRAFVWSHSTGVQDLTDLLGAQASAAGFSYFTSALGATDDGFILAQGRVLGQSYESACLVKLAIANPRLETQPATIVDSTQVQLHGLAADVANMNVWFEYGLTTAYGSSLAASPSVVTGVGPIPITGAVSGLQPATTYHFRLKGTNGNGSIYSEDRTFTTNDRPPVVFIPGIAGSMLIGGSDTGKHGDGEYLWPTIFGPRIYALNLRVGFSDVKAVDIVRVFDPEVPNIDPVPVYGPFVTHMTELGGQGYEEFDLDEHPERRTNGYMLNQSFAKPPTFFPFPYDWRRSGADHVADLHKYISDISQLHGGAKVSIVAHSMGGLLARRYLLAYPNDHLVDKVATIGSPFWGAPVAIYRMLVGDFYGKDKAEGKLDSFNNGFVRATLPTFPAFHELLPSTSYLQNCGTTVFEEKAWDFDGKNGGFESYTTAKLHEMLDSKALPDTPSFNNLSFHGFASGRQDDWHMDDSTVAYLHISGVEQVDNTTVKVTAVSKTARTLLGYTVDTVEKWHETKGPGDGTVPLLSSDRLNAYRSPATARAILSGGAEVQHNPLMANPEVWTLLEDFLDDGVLAPNALAAQQTAFVSAAAAGSAARKKIAVYGAGYVRVRDAAGNENTKLSDMVARSVPGVDIQYGGDKPWVDIECDVNSVLTIEGVPPQSAIEIEVTEIDGTGAAVSLQRFRFSAATSSWRLQPAPSASSDLRVDANSDGTFADDEKVGPSHTVAGSSIDTTAPSLSLDLAVTGQNVSVSLLGNDGGQLTPSIFYSLGGGSLQTYTAPLVFPSSETRQLRVFAEDGNGNTSGLIQTAINPSPTITAPYAGTVSIQWPISEAYVLEESSDLVNWSASSTPVNRAGFYDNASISTAANTKKFFRLRSQQISK